jgi:selenocysteine-specific elongation factor
MPGLIGTAGHVDHGKTSLIQALTGIDADRLPEEKTRGLTIDIGFAHLDLPQAGRCSIVDVPGHERFLTNMLVGSLAMETALLCIAGDEGVMPQTEEHAAILELLPIKHLVVAMTKSDLLDEDLRELALEEIRGWLETTRFSGAPIIPCSSQTREGIDELLAILDKAVLEESEAAAGGWRLPIDRVFAIKGHGTVVTGSLGGGVVKAGDEAEIQPGGHKVRVKSIQVHGDAPESATPGMRTALNLTGIKTEELRRGMIVAQPGITSESTSIDLKIDWRNRPKHAARVRLAVGAEDAVGRVFLNDQDESLAQVVFDDPVASCSGMPVILRLHSPPILLGGGVVVNPTAERRRKSASAPSYDSDEDISSALIRIAESQPGGVATDVLAAGVGMTLQAIGKTLEDLKKSGEMVGFAGHWMSRSGLEQAAEKFINQLVKEHESEPEKALLPRERIVSRAGLPWAGKPLDRIIAQLASSARIRVKGTQIAEISFRPTLKPKQEVLLQRVEELLGSAGLEIPSPKKISQSLNLPPQAVDQILSVGFDTGRLVWLDEGIYLTAGDLSLWASKVREAFAEQPFSASEFRDKFGGSRRTVIPLLEQLDALGVTVRQGDKRSVRVQ